MNNIFYTLILCLCFVGLQAQDIRFSFEIDNTTPDNARAVDIYAESIGADENMTTYQSIFYYNSAESTYTSFDTSPAAALGWNVAGGDTQNNSAGTNPGVTIVHDMKLTVGLIDNDIQGSTFTATKVKIGTLIFDNTPGNATAGSDLFMSNVTLDPGLNYSGNDFTAHDVAIEGAQSQNLPLKLTSFEVEKVREGAGLTWSTEIEENFSHFELQRSMDGVNFRPFADVQGQGFNAGVNKYSAIDANIPFVGNSEETVFYRLKMIDLDGKYEFSEIRSVMFDERASDVTVFPNPTADFIAVKADSPISNVTIYNIDGRVVLNQKVGGQIDLSSYDSGMYKVIVTSEAGTVTKTVIKVD